MQFKISILACILFETTDEVELGTGSSTDDFAVVCDAERSLGFDLV